MAIITLASHLESMRGSIGNTVYYSRCGRAYARVRVMPANPDTEGQQAVRRAFGDAVRSWQALPGEERDAWNRRASRLPMSGYNLYISRYMKQHVPRNEGSAAYRGVKGEHTPPYIQASPSVSTPFPRNIPPYPPALSGNRSPGRG